MRVLVTGGAGYVGSVVVEELIAAGHEPTVFDNLSKGHRGAVAPGAPLITGELADRDAVREALGRSRIEAVVHMAADSLVGESMQHPGKYYRNNVVNGLVLVDCMVELGISRLVFSSTAAVYGEPAKQPIEESDPKEPTNPYGESKLVFERALRWYTAAHRLGWVALRYFNAAGATARCGEVHAPETHLIPLVLQVAAGTRDAVEIYGDDYPTPDGTCVRDYVHVSDLARAHVLALDALAGAGAGRAAAYNLGCGRNGYSVREVIAAAERVVGHAVPARVAPRRPGDPAVLVASSDRISTALGWSPLQQLDTIVGSAWAWMQAHPRGYAAS